MWYVHMCVPTCIYMCAHHGIPDTHIRMYLDRYIWVCVILQILVLPKEAREGESLDYWDDDDLHLALGLEKDRGYFIIKHLIPRIIPRRGMSYCLYQKKNLHVHFM